MKTVFTDFTVVEEELFDKFSCVKEYYKGKLKELNENSDVICDEKQSGVFHYVKEESISLKNISYLIQFSFAVLGLNAHLNIRLLDEKNRLKVETLKVVIIKKSNFSCCSYVQPYKLILKTRKSS
jgi:hypothetical protein